MELKVGVAVAGKASWKRGYQFFRARNKKKNTSNHPLEAMTTPKADCSGSGSGRGGGVSCTEEDEGVVRMKIVMRKSDLKQLVQVMSGINGETYRPSMSPLTVLSSSSVEQRLNLLRKMHLSRASALKGNRQMCWSPALQSIPEEL